jgi:branched-chain amino acid transport system substrate-binding protein
MTKKLQLRTSRGKASALAGCIGLVLILTVATLAIGPAVAQAAGQPKTLKIGALRALTGFFSVFDAVDQTDTENMAKMINKKGGITIKGQRYNIELVSEDTKSTLEGTTAGANRLVYDKKVKYVIGPSGFYCAAAGAVFESNKVLHVLGWSTCQPGEIDASTPYGFLGNVGSVGLTIAALKATKKEYPNVAKIALVTPDDGSMRYLLPAIKRSLSANGFTMVGDIVGYPNEIQDCSPIASKLNAIKEAEAILQVNGAPPHVGNILKGLRELGNSKPYIVVTGADGDDIIAIAGKSAATDVISATYTPRAPGNPPLVEELYSMRTGPKKFFPVMGPLWLSLLVNVMKAADSVDPEVVRAKWEKMDKIETLYGTGLMSGDQTYGIRHHAIGFPFPYLRLMDGKVLSYGWADVGPIP